MSTILEQIVSAKRQELEELKQRQPLSAFENELTRSGRDFLQALKAPAPAFILECKKASPSQGLIRKDFNLPSIAAAYQAHASAISVLTESKYFQGSLDHLRMVRAAVYQPVLCKDFFVDKYQVYLARRYGADAVLLILAVLNDSQHRELSHLAGQLGMAAITEVSNQDEMQRAIDLGCPLVGINNRNLRDLSIDLDRTREMAGTLRKQALVISESGFHTHQQVREMSQFVDGFLIGSSLMACDDLEMAVRSIIYGDNKVCGLTRAQDAHVAASSGAVYGGLIFAESSPRRLSIIEALRVIEGAALRFVGVFQDQSVEVISKAAHKLSLHAVQLHGQEDAEFVGRLRSELDRNQVSEVQIWKAAGVDRVAAALGTMHVDRVVVDHRQGEQMGGTGQRFEWSQLQMESRDRLMVAGGLNQDNASSAARLGCAGLDFNSGLEEKPGIKSPDKIRTTFKRLRQYNTP